MKKFRFKIRDWFLFTLVFGVLLLAHDFLSDPNALAGFPDAIQSWFAGRAFLPTGFH